jgi:1-acyl-sn-glycerol-3-phosphate acyltransferase
MKLLSALRVVFVMFIPFPIYTTLFIFFGSLRYVIFGNRSWMDLVGHIWARWTLALLGIKVEVKGKTNVPEKACLFLFNHTSFMDIFAMMSEIPGIHFGAKIQLFSIPIFGIGLRAAGMLPIARENREQAIRILTEAEDRAKKGEKFALSPEGGRNDEEKLLPFKSGPFIFAIKTGVPIVPVIIKGAKDAWPKHHLLPVGGKVIHLEFLPQVKTQKYTIDQRSLLAEEVRTNMSQFF